MLVATLLTLLAAISAGTATGPPVSTSNRWAEPTRGILAQHCGACHIPKLPTSVPRALAVFDLTENLWYGRLTRSQLDSVLTRVHAIRELAEPDRSIVENFVSCARDGICPAQDP